MKALVLTFILIFSKFLSASDLILAEQTKISSSVLNEKRELLIKLPQNYQDNSENYPVLYVLHAQWDMLSTLSVLDLLDDQIPHFIVVGVISKGQELIPDEGKVTPFAKFLTTEVVPYVNKKYRTAPFNILSGHSNSGRFVLDLWSNNTAPFEQYFAFSPSLDDGYIIEKMTNTKVESLQGKAPLTVTIANEGDHMQVPFTKLTERLKPLDSFAFKKFPKQSHRTTKHPSLQFALQSTFMGWEPSYEVKVSGLEGLKAHYSALSKKFGFKVTVPNETLQRLVAHYAISKNMDNELKQHIEFTIKQTPQGLDALFEIAQYLLANDYKPAGKIILNKLCVKAKNDQRCKNEN